jgi:hypothetical protein
MTFSSIRFLTSYAGIYDKAEGSVTLDESAETNDWVYMGDEKYYGTLAKKNFYDRYHFLTRQRNLLVRSANVVDKTLKDMMPVLTIIVMTNSITLAICLNGIIVIMLMRCLFSQSIAIIYQNQFVNTL